MLYLLVYPSGYCEEFTILDCAEIYRLAWGGELWAVDVATAVKSGELTE